MKRTLLATHVLLAAVLLAGCATSRIPVGEQVVRSFVQDADTAFSGRYLIYLPPGYSKKGDPSPLLLFLHGAGERGTDLDLVKVHGPPKLVGRGEVLPFIVVSPQTPLDHWWSAPYLSALVDHIEETLNVDRDRLYVTGLSMGGFGTWDLAMKEPNRFAALAPVCGGGDSEKVCSLRQVPTWVFHGGKDTVVPLSRSEEMVDALEDCGGNVTLTVYPEAGHDSWTETYDNPLFYQWLLEQRRQPE